jgi:hypothetical protein
MRIYVAYLLAALSSFYLVMLYYGVSAGFASPVPVLALMGALVLSAVAAPVLVYHARAGLWLGALGCSLLLPYSALFLGSVVGEWKWHWLMLLGLLPAVLVLFSSYCTVRALRTPRVAGLAFPTHPWLKGGLVLLPLLLWASYLVSIRSAFG